MGSAQVDLVVPVKSLNAAKSRLRGAADQGVGDAGTHARLALALALDTIAAVRDATLVGALLVVTSDALVAAEFATAGIEVVPDGPAGGLNAAYERGAELLRGRRDGPVGALQADLPALRATELDDAITAALAWFDRGGHRAFYADADGTGTTFLLAAPGVALDPRFGAGSAHRHLASGARMLDGDWPGLRHDVDTADDLRLAADLGLGVHTRGVLTPCPGG